MVCSQIKFLPGANATRVSKVRGKNTDTKFKIDVPTTAYKTNKSDTLTVSMKKIRKALPNIHSSEKEAIGQFLDKLPWKKVQQFLWTDKDNNYLRQTSYINAQSTYFDRILSTFANNKSIFLTTTTDDDYKITRPLTKDEMKQQLQRHKDAMFEFVEVYNKYMIANGLYHIIPENFSYFGIMEVGEKGKLHMHWILEINVVEDLASFIYISISHKTMNEMFKDTVAAQNHIHFNYSGVYDIIHLAQYLFKDAHMLNEAWQEKYKYIPKVNITFHNDLKLPIDVGQLDERAVPCFLKTITTTRRRGDTYNRIRTSNKFEIKRGDSVIRVYSYLVECKNVDLKNNMLVAEQLMRCFIQQKDTINKFIGACSSITKFYLLVKDRITDYVSVLKLQLELQKLQMSMS